MFRDKEQFNADKNYFLTAPPLLLEAAWTDCFAIRFQPSIKEWFLSYFVCVPSDLIFSLW